MITDRDMGRKNYIAHYQGLTQYPENEDFEGWDTKGKRRKKIGQLLEYDMDGNKR
ncbi:MAG: hypothetical protein IT280_01665 [Ignavibacteria bacterium]|nr:hypothetical protein [Ignavibacteria bacterium]